MQDLDWFSAVTEMWAQGQGASCGLMTVCWGLEQREDPAWFEGVRDMGSGLFAGGLNKARNQPENQMQAQKCWSVASTRAAPGLVHGRDREAGSGVFVQRLEQGQDPDCVGAGPEMWAQECLSGLEHGKHPGCFL